MRQVLFDLFLLGLLALLAIPPERNRIHGRHLLSTTIIDRNGRPLREVLSTEDGVAHWQRLSDISPALVHATLVSEDRRFFRHPGVDPLATARALRRNLRAGRIVAGGSTITQQLIHNIHDYPRRHIGYKLLEALQSLHLEFHLAKSEILEAYLNRVPYGNLTFGAEAAARRYFAKSCSALSLAEACFLAAIPRSPARYDPYRFPERTRARSREILNQLYRRRTVSELQHRIAVSESLTVQPPSQTFVAPHFVDLVLQRHLSADAQPPISNHQSSVSNDPSATTCLRTTLDLSLQEQVERLLRRTVRNLRGNNVTNAAALVLRTGTCEVLALCGSVDYFDRFRDGQFNACLGRRQPGSTLKPFTYELALEQGITAAELLPDLDYHATEPGGDYVPRNYDERWHGPVRLRNALACSYNIPAVRVAERLGVEQLLQHLHRLGFSSLNRPARHYGLALTLGDGEVTLLELARAYACLANLGWYLPERLLLEGPPASEPAPVLSEPAAYVITDILCDNPARSPAFGEYSPLNLGFPCAAKTGTSKDCRDNWTIGFTRDHVVAVWVGNFDNTPMHGVSGITGAAPVFRDIMNYLHRVPPPAFPEPAGIVRCPVCSKSGAVCNPDCPNSISELFIAGFEPVETCCVHQRVRLDAGTGLAAGPLTRPEDVRELVYEVYPPLYYGWMQSVGLPFPPTRPDTLPQTGLAIIFPDDNSIFKLDPDLDRDFQSIPLQASAPAGCPEVSWAIDGAPLASVEPPFQQFWPMTPGRHRITCETAAGTRAEVSILVLD